MKNNDEENKPKKTEKSSPKIHEEKMLFSEREVKSIVKDFVAAYISGQIKINFPNVESIMESRTSRGEKINHTKACKVEADIKKRFTGRIAICSGTTKATPEEQEVAVNELFSIIVSMRNGNRIEGVFTEYALEARIRRLEEGMDKVNNLVEEIVEWIMRGVVDK